MTSRPVTQRIGQSRAHSFLPKSPSGCRLRCCLGISIGVGMDDVSLFSSSELASLIVDGQRQRDRAESEWLAWLGEFDVQGGWALFGCVSCVNWLVQHCGMSRPTAKD